MPIAGISQQDPDGYVLTSFGFIPSMQTYLVVFTISDFVFIENTSVIPHQRIYAKESSIIANEAELALKVSPELMEFCKEYFGMNFTFLKMDQVSV
jgi:aminopeptidase N